MKKWIAGGVILSLASLAVASDITVFAAASLCESLKAVSKRFEQQTGNKVVLNFAASGTLARQIEAGAPADLFFSADEASVETLMKKGLLMNETLTNRLTNRLAIVLPADSSLKMSSPRDLAGPEVKRVALGDVRTTPVGRYAREYCMRLKIWDAVEPRVIPLENVRAVLAAVETGNVDAGVVYKTDAKVSAKVRMVFEVPQADGPEIRYPMVLVKGTKEPGAARKLLEFLSSDEAGRVFQSFGFEVLE